MTRLVELEPTKFVRFLSDLWTQRNWQTNAQPRGEGRYLVQGQRGDGTKGLMLVLPTVETTVETEHIKGFVAHAKKRGVDTVVVATQGEFADAVRGFATNHDVTLFDRDELGETVADCSVKISFMELYKDQVIDLLAERPRSKLSPMSAASPGLFNGVSVRRR